MPNRRRLNWIYDDDKQQFTTPAGGTVKLGDIAQMLQDQRLADFCWLCRAASVGFRAFAIPTRRL